MFLSLIFIVTGEFLAVLGKNEVAVESGKFVKGLFMDPYLNFHLVYVKYQSCDIFRMGMPLFSYKRTCLLYKPND